MIPIAAYAVVAALVAVAWSSPRPFKDAAGYTVYTPCPEERRAHDALGELGEVRFHNSGDTHVG